MWLIPQLPLHNTPNTHVAHTLKTKQRHSQYFLETGKNEASMLHKKLEVISVDGFLIFETTITHSN